MDVENNDIFSYYYFVEKRDERINEETKNENLQPSVPLNIQKTLFIDKMDSEPIDFTLSYGILPLQKISTQRKSDINIGIGMKKIYKPGSISGNQDSTSTQESNQSIRIDNIIGGVFKLFK